MAVSSFARDVAAAVGGQTDEEEGFDCPICLELMTTVDLAHPLQCNTHRCDYNFCRSCIESLISSSKDDYMEASDGNLHVKVFLHCPNCRSDLSETIRDTLLLRRADAVLLGVDVDGGVACGASPVAAAAAAKDEDEKPNAADLHMKDALEDAQVKYAVEEARTREADFFRKKLCLDDPFQKVPSKLSAVTVDSISDDEDEEWGVEADLIQGVHASFRCPAQPQRHREQRWLLIDDTLFAGLGDFMSVEKQERVTDLMTSGDPAKLAEAAYVLRQAADVCHHKDRRRRFSKRNSVYSLIEEARQSHEKASDEKKGDASRRRFRHLQMEMELREQAEYLRSHPLPVRMPKCVELTRLDPGNRAFPLSFCDDVWDGTVRDAFCKLSVGFLNQVSKNETRHSGVSKILGGDGPVRIDLEKPRVLVSYVQAEGGRQGVMKGDVVTHLNGEPFEGDSDELRARIAALSGDTFTLVFNASRPVAEALKRRAFADF